MLEIKQLISMVLKDSGVMLKNMAIALSRCTEAIL